MKYTKGNQGETEISDFRLKSTLGKLPLIYCLESVRYPRLEKLSLIYFLGSVTHNLKSTDCALKSAI
jgi:hypothetical protein